ncbi:hypothetical protein [Streptomyces scopuliridis]|uniref:hypothetical protein n=1 Tax=Streptomyces scopuliridis TaxID=452529 RepID=UPI003679C74F
MQRRLISLASISLLLVAGCGGQNETASRPAGAEPLAAPSAVKLDLDIERVQGAVAEKAMERWDMREGGYKADDVLMVKICETVRTRDREFGFDGRYVVFWKTTDGEIKADLALDDYEASNKPWDEIIRDRCMTLN